MQPLRWRGERTTLNGSSCAWSRATARWPPAASRSSPEGPPSLNTRPRDLPPFRSLPPDRPLLNMPPDLPPLPSQITPDSLLLHYYSSRPGLWPIVVGVLKGLSKEYFGFEVRARSPLRRGFKLRWLRSFLAPGRGGPCCLSPHPTRRTSLHSASRLPARRLPAASVLVADPLLPPLAPLPAGHRAAAQPRQWG